MNLKSIRWRLPLSYAGIALLAAIAMGAVLLSVLRGYYTERERAYLFNSANTIRDSMVRMLVEQVPQEAVETQLRNLAFISQTRVRVLDMEGQVLFDSGAPAAPPLAAVRPLSPAPIVTPVAPNGTPGPEDNVQAVPAFPEIGPGGLFERFTMEGPDLRLEGDPVQPDFIALVPGPVSIYGFNWDTGLEMGGRRSNMAYELPILDVRNRMVGKIQLSEGPAYGWAIVESVFQAWLVASSVAILLAAGTGWLISRQVTIPLTALTEVTTQMAHGNLSARARAGGADEFGALGRTFNEMANRIEETVVALRLFVADAAHELQTPLTALRTNLELASQEQGRRSRHEYLERAQEQALRLSRLTEALLDLSRLESGSGGEERIPVDLVPLVRNASEPYAAQAEQKELVFTLNLPDEPVQVEGNPAQLKRAVANLLENAVKFTPSGGAIEAGLSQEAGEVVVWVQDSGIGIPDEDLDRLFDRFHRGRNAAAYPGSGLGLAIVKAIVMSHAGEVGAENISSGGARFNIRLPLNPAS